jgi:hypothetical protein
MLSCECLLSDRRAESWRVIFETQLELRIMNSLTFDLYTYRNSTVLLLVQGSSQESSVTHQFFVDLHDSCCDTLHLLHGACLCIDYMSECIHPNKAGNYQEYTFFACSMHDHNYP